ncbi:MAG: GAF domain-containing protein [Proteobacteria bacterium]|nr:GAF domain-containing protein [Pseudomonadota bacterium]
MKKDTREDLYRKQLITMLKFGALVNSSLNVEDVLNSAMKWAEEFMAAEASTVYELDEKKNELFIRLARGEKKDPIKKMIFKVGEGIAGYVVQTGRPMVIQDVKKEERFSDKIDKLTGFETRSIICVPLLWRNRSVGALQVINKKAGKRFSRADLELLVGMAQQIAIAMENANLYQLLEERVLMTTQELRVTQEKLIRSERLVGLGHLVQGIAHEIRNPIMTIGGFAQRIKRELSENPKFEKYADIVIEEANRLEHMVREVREFGDAQSATLSLESAEKVFVETLETFSPLAKKQGVKLLTDIDHDLPLLEMDLPQLVLALNNILENALESMAKGGTLTLRVKRQKRHLLIAVEDTGCGIPQEQLDAVYDPFVTSKTRGAGLGLTLVHQIIMNHHGDIRITSDVGKGTTVTIRLPMHEG